MMKNEDKTILETSQTAEKDVLSRRQALTRLGVAATVVYAAPTLLHLKSAQARSSGRTGGSSRSSRGSRDSRGRHRKRR